MEERKFIKNPLIKGTLILTVGGLITRLIGFYYRVFLNDLIGARQIGIYQLVIPIYIVAISFCCQGFQAALTRLIPTYIVKKQKNQVWGTYYIALLFSMALSIIATMFLYCNANFLGTHYLNNPETIPCIRVISLGIPFVAWKCCIHGYFMGMKQSSILAVSQLIEQLFRVVGTFLLAVGLQSEQLRTAILATYGILIGEITSFLYSYIAFRRHKSGSARSAKYIQLTKSLLHDSIPFTANRLSTTLLQSVEATLIPAMLTLFFQDGDYALTVFGVMTGMAIPFILLPSTLTNSLCSMLMPAVSEQHTKDNQEQLANMTNGSLHFCLLVGVFSTVLFVFFGKELGMTFFQNSLAGEFIVMLAFLCPFIYVSATLSSILNGLGKTGLNLFLHILSISVRILFIVLLVPKVGIRGCMWGMLASYLLLTGCLGFSILPKIKINIDCYKSIVIPVFMAVLVGTACFLLYEKGIDMLSAKKEITNLIRLVILTITICGYGIIYFSITLFHEIKRLKIRE